jgi:hypothetical protein
MTLDISTALARAAGRIEREGTPGESDFAGFIPGYTAHLREKGHTRATIYSYRHCLRGFCRWLGRHPVTPEVLAEYRCHVAPRFNRGRTYLAAAAGFLRWLKATGKLSTTVDTYRPFSRPDDRRVTCGRYVGYRARLRGTWDPSGPRPRKGKGGQS